MAHPRVTIVGATGAVGKVALAVLEERAFPMERLRLTASPRSVGRKVMFKGEELTVEATAPDVFAESDIAFISANDDVSRDMALAARDRGCVVIDDSGVWRMDQGVPLVVPEINAGDVDAHAGILSIPNCSTTPLVMVLDALRQASPIRRVIAATYQSVTGTGTAALAELDEQTRDYFAGNEARTDQYPHPIAFNLLPHVGSFRDGGHTSEEMKMLNESRKILHEPDPGPFGDLCPRARTRVPQRGGQHRVRAPHQPRRGARTARGLSRYRGRGRSRYERLPHAARRRGQGRGVRGAHPRGRGAPERDRPLARLRQPSARARRRTRCR